MRPFRTANTRPLLGAVVVAAAAIGFGGIGAAQTSGDGLTQSPAYHGPFLTWPGKTPAAGLARQPAPEPAGAEAAPASEFAAWPAPAPGAPRLRPLASAASAPTVAPAYVSPHAYAPARRPKPAAVAAYVAPPAPAVRRQRPAQLAVSAPPTAIQPAQPVTQQLAQNDTPAAPPASGSLPPTGAHFYSLHREYGLTPDQVVTPKDRPMVLIGPPDNPSPQTQDDADDHGPSDKRGGAGSADE